MTSPKFLPGDLVLANILVYKRPSQCSTSTQRGGYWPAKVTRKLQKSKRQVICYGTREEVKVTIQSMIAYDKASKKIILTQTPVNKDSMLALAWDEIEADFQAKTRTAEQLHLSGEPKLITSVVKSAPLLSIKNINNTVMNLWNFYVEKSIGKTSGICHLPHILKDFVNDHKEVMSREENYKDFIYHVCSLEEMGLISSIEVKSTVDNLAAISFGWNYGETEKNDDSLRGTFDYPNPSTVGVNIPVNNANATTQEITQNPANYTNIVLKDDSANEVSEIPSDTVIGSPTKCTTNVIENALPSERTKAVFRERNIALVSELQSDMSTSLMEMDHCSHILNEAESNKGNNISKYGTNEVLDDSPSSVTDCSSEASIPDSGSLTIVKNSLPNLPIRLEIVTSADVVDNLVDPSSSFNVLSDPTQTPSLTNCHTTPILTNDPTTTTSVLEDPPQSVSVYPSNTCLLAPVEPLDAASLTGDVLDQETYKDVFSGGEETVIDNNSDKISEVVTSEITIVEEICPHMENEVTEAVENISIVELDKEAVVAQETRRNLNDNCIKEQEEGLEVIVIEENDENEDDEVEIIDAVGSTTFVNTVLKCDSERKQANRTKRKRPMETMKTNKKYLPYHQNTDEVTRVNRTSSSQCNPMQALQGYCRCCRTRIDQSGSTNQDVNGNNCAVKITMNIEMSADCFSRVTEGIPNLREMVDMYAEKIILNVDSC